MLHQSALLAQLVARGSDKAKVIGSSPVESRKKIFLFGGGRPAQRGRRRALQLERAGIPLGPDPGTNPGKVGRARRRALLLFYCNWKERKIPPPAATFYTRTRRPGTNPCRSVKIENGIRTP